MHNIQSEFNHKKETQIISDKSTKDQYIPPKITQLIMNDVIAGGVAALNEAQSGIINS